MKATRTNFCRGSVPCGRAGCAAHLQQAVAGVLLEEGPPGALPPGAGSGHLGLQLGQRLQAHRDGPALGRQALQLLQVRVVAPVLGGKQIFMSQQFHPCISCQPNFKPYAILLLSKIKFHRKGKEGSVSIHCYSKQFSHTAFILTVILTRPAGLWSSTTFHSQLSKCCLFNSRSCIGADVKSTGILT